VNAETTLGFLEQLKQAYPQAPKIHVILDNAGYHRSQMLQNSAHNNGVALHYLPPYSPNS
jgi:transposase